MREGFHEDFALGAMATDTTSPGAASSPRGAEEGAALQQRVKRFIQDSFFIDEVGNDQSFLESGIIDSLGILQIVSFVESELGLPVPDTDLVPANFDSIDRIAAYVARRRHGPDGPNRSW